MILVLGVEIGEKCRKKIDETSKSIAIQFAYSWGRVSKLLNQAFKLVPEDLVGRVFPMLIWPRFDMG